MRINTKYHDPQLPDKNTVPELLDACIRKEVKKETKQSFMTFFEVLIKNSEAGVRPDPKTSKPISNNTIKNYSTTFKHLKAFQEKKQMVDFKTIDLRFYTSYTEFLIGEKAEKNQRAFMQGRSQQVQNLIRLLQKKGIDPQETDNFIYRRIDTELGDICNIKMDEIHRGKREKPAQKAHVEFHNSANDIINRFCSRLAKLLSTRLGVPKIKNAS
ncbi:MAG: phage integrase SAM-like domain-containing protein [Flavisolibacter sp.]